MAERELDLSFSPYLHLVSAFLAMEPPNVLISLARDCGGGSITKRVQSFIWDHCICKADATSYTPYLKIFLKKLIVEVESKGDEVLDELYEQFASYISSLKDDQKGNARILKYISFIFTDDCAEFPTYPKLRKLVVPLQCSLNMLEGDTGCSIWPSGLFLSELILSFPGIFSRRSCFEVGSGVGLVGICLTHVKASKVMLTDGDLSSYANLKINLELNQLRSKTDISERTTQDSRLVDCIHLPWESATESVLQDFTLDIVLGADVIYDPLCLPHLVRVLAALLDHKKSRTPLQSDNCNDTQPGSVHLYDEAHNTDNIHCSDTSEDQVKSNYGPNVEYVRSKLEVCPVAFIASVIRNIDTFNCFLMLAGNANLSVEDVTERMKPSNLLPYMESYKRSSVRLFILSRICK